MEYNGGQKTILRGELFMKKEFGLRSDGQQAYLYTIRSGKITAEISDHGATLVKLFVPDSEGNVADVVLGFDTPDEYTASGTFFGATVGRNSNRVGQATFDLYGKKCKLDANDNGVNNLHSGFDPYKNRLWEVITHTENSICLGLESPNGDQGFPGNAHIRVTYTLDNTGSLRITYDGICDQDTVFNMTNHTYFNLAGHDHPEKAMNQILSMPARVFTFADEMSIPTGELRSVAGTPMDFREPKPIGRDLGEDYDALKNQGGYDHNFVIGQEGVTKTFARVESEKSGIGMECVTDQPGVQIYVSNGLAEKSGKGGVALYKHQGICLETQHYPDSPNHQTFPSTTLKAGDTMVSETSYRFYRLDKTEE